MAYQLRITCIKKAPRNDPHHHITHIGGSNANGTPWGLSETEAIIGIKNGTYSFYVSVNNVTANVVIAISPYGHEYLKTVADGYPPNNLLSLPECNW